MWVIQGHDGSAGKAEPWVVTTKDPFSSEEDFVAKKQCFMISS